MAEGVVHACPPAGSGIMPCCGRTPFERLADRMTLDPVLVTCSTHLSECWLSDYCPSATEDHGIHHIDGIPPFCTECGDRCICDRLRACEERVRDEALALRMGYADGVEAGYARGLARGLDAARDIVDRLRGERMVSHNYGVALDDMAAAIDGLRDPAPTAAAQDIADDRAEHTDRDEGRA